MGHPSEVTGSGKFPAALPGRFPFGELRANFYGIAAPAPTRRRAPRSPATRRPVPAPASRHAGTLALLSWARRSRVRMTMRAE